MTLKNVCTLPKSSFSLQNNLNLSINADFPDFSRPTTKNISESSKFFECPFTNAFAIALEFSVNDASTSKLGITVSELLRRPKAFNA